jgi:hypothetical protein
MGRYFSTKGTSSSNLPAKEEPPAPPPAPPNHEEADILQFYLARQKFSFQSQNGSQLIDGIENALNSSCNLIFRFD